MRCKTRCATCSLRTAGRLARVSRRARASSCGQWRPGGGSQRAGCVGTAGPNAWGARFIQTQPPPRTHPEGKQHGAGVHQRRRLGQAAQRCAAQVGLLAGRGGGRQERCLRRGERGRGRPGRQPQTRPHARCPRATATWRVSVGRARRVAPLLGSQARGRGSEPGRGGPLQHCLAHTHRLALVVRGAEARGAVEEAQGPQDALRGCGSGRTRTSSAGKPPSGHWAALLAGAAPLVTTATASYGRCVCYCGVPFITLSRLGGAVSASGELLGLRRGAQRKALTPRRPAAVLLRPRWSTACRCTRRRWRGRSAGPDGRVSRRARTSRGGCPNGRPP